jgi:hypothetical protein
LRNFYGGFGVVYCEMPNYLLFVPIFGYCLNPLDCSPRFLNIENRSAWLRQVVKTFFKGSRGFMNFGPTPTSSLFVLDSKSEKLNLERKTTIHEQVPNTNIKFL